jgi:glyceraldehyde-3-phosphate dehydrogenase/erythrose-4-phosphate dehydrogenase
MPRTKSWCRSTSTASAFVHRRPGLHGGRDGSLVKVLAWYDNEWGYSSRVRDLISYIAKSL